jgi:hypothetical protein
LQNSQANALKNGFNEELFGVKDYIELTHFTDKK